MDTKYTKKIALLLSLITAGSAVCACAPSEPVIDAPEGYTLVWHDEFDGDALNEENWTMDYRRPGWVNNELQAYAASEENIFIENGDLVIQPLMTINDRGHEVYTSGRLTSQRHQSFQYGRIEARIRVPQGQGYLPAFWMMPEDESYGGWPRSGEIDIMEVLGSDTDTLYGTIHYGDPHRQNQGIYDLPEGDFATEYHVYAVDWEPGLISWYIDDELYYQTDYWYSASSAQSNPYPAPFDQPFYIILNVAVGGNWPGDPDENTPFDERAQMRVDYVRVFQRAEYDENVTMPEPVLEMREADESGNYILNPLFEGEDYGDDTAWRFLLNAGGDGNAETSDGAAVVSTVNAGSEDYSLQLVQAGLPLEEGAHYTLSFTAYSDEDRQMNVTVSAPDYDYARYFNDVTLDLTTEPQQFTFEFDMESGSDDNGRLEFNIGGTSSSSAVYITDVRLEKAD